MPSRPALTRRGFIRAAAASAIAPALPPPVLDARPRVEPSPDLRDERILRFVAGLRPFREGSYRLDVEPTRDGVIVHNYGHGGAGFTLSWGCAMEATALLRKQMKPPKRVAVLGAGVVGLTTAMTLLHAGYRVSIHARSFPPDTTSNLAGAQWSPALVDRGRGADARARWRRILTNSLRRFRGLSGREWGISERRNYVARGSQAFRGVPDGVLAPRRALARLPFAGTDHAGFVQDTLLIEPPIFLPRIVEELRREGVEMHTTTIGSREALNDLGPRVVVDCLGLGAREVFGDTRLVPIRGQLVLVEPQDLPWLLSHRDGYVFPRTDAIVVGGTAERGVTSASPVDRTCRRILSRGRAFFDPAAGGSR